MKGTISAIYPNTDIGEFGFINGDDSKKYYFNNGSIKNGLTTRDFFKYDTVEFTPISRPYTKYDYATGIALVSKDSNDQKVVSGDNSNGTIEIQPSPIKFYSPGYYKHLDIKRMFNEHLKKGSGEQEVLEKLKDILYVSHINHHDVGHNKLFPFCLVGATDLLKQYIRGQYEFLLVFSHFNSCDWQQSTIKAAQFIRHRREISERRPLVNFFMLVSNARTLKSEIDKMKGGTAAAIIPFTFTDILKCINKQELRELILSRFDEYLFENNMLGEENPIEEDTLLFGDRGKIADSIVQRCIERKHSGIFGLRRSGKSSVLQAVARRLEQNKIKHIIIQSRSSLEVIDSWKTALYDISREIKICVSGLKQLETETRKEFNSRLKLNSAEDDYIRRPSQSFVEDVRLYLQETDNSFVIAIDEVELITYNTATSPMWQDLESYKGFWGALRDSGCALVICGVNSTINERSTILYKGKTCDNPMYERIHNCAGFSKTYLPSFTDSQTKVMINTLGGYSNIAFSNVYVDINRAFGGQPYAIRQFCAYLFDRVKTYRTPHEVYEVSKPTFDALLVEFNNSEKGTQLFNTILQHVAIYKDEYEMLKRIAHSPEKYRTVNHSEISLIDHIEKYGLVEYDKCTLFVTFNIQSVQEYICRISQKRPEDMNNDERRQYIQEKVMICEKKLKKYILNFYTYNGVEAAGRSVFQGLMNGAKPKVLVNKTATPTPNPGTCKFKEFFDHSKFILYFSTIKIIITNNWTTLGSTFTKQGISPEKFKVCMDDLNAGRNDADHYDAEDMNCPDEWEITDKVMQAFCIAYNTMESFFDTCNL